MPRADDDAEQHAVSVRSASASPSRNEGRLVTGAMLAGRYRIVSLLGRGGMGEVFKAEDLKLNQTVALKFLPEKIALDGGMLARFHNEVRIARQVAHPNVCHVYDIGEVEGRHFLSMEFIDGEDLSSLLRRIGHLPGIKAVEIARQICAGLAAAHEQGVLHRDLKPANVMIDGRGKARITDFGLAVVSEELREEDVLAGTPAYMAPEQLTGKEVTQRSDIYSLGLVLYELFTGKRVYESQSIHELIELHDKSAPATPSSHMKDIDPLVERVILRCLERDPKARPASAVQVALALPGGDPLQAALAMGETPSPEMVAASGETTGLRPQVATACLAAIVGLLMGYMWLDGKVMLISKMPMENPPEVLAHKARDLAVQFGYSDKPTDTAYGFLQDGDLEVYAVRRNSLLSRERLATGRPAYYEYWYRESPLYLQGSKYNGFNPAEIGHVTLDEPPQEIAGMLAMRLDPLGRLRYFAAVPPQVEQPPEPAESLARSFDRAALFSAVGLDPSHFTAAESQWTPLASWDERAAWTGTYPDQADVPIRLEAAAYRGRLVYFQIIEPWTRAARMPSGQRTLGGFWFSEILIWVMFIIALAFARRNYRQGRGDRRGAFRLAIFAAIMVLLEWVLSASHTPHVEESGALRSALAVSLYTMIAYWSVYMALEPFIRRRLPETIITWSRLLAGQFRDPLLGRDVLIGILAACGYWMVSILVSFFFLSNGRLFGIHPDSLLDARHNLWLLTVVVMIGLFFPIFVLLLFFLLRIILRRQWLATVGLILFFGLLAQFETLEEISAALFFLWWCGGIFLLLRFGLVAGCLYYFSGYMLTVYPITSNFSVWYATSGLFAIAVLLLLAGFAFYTSLGGQKVFEGKLLEE
jgi:serine/threonine-protein kinase